MSKLPHLEAIAPIPMTYSQLVKLHKTRVIVPLPKVKALQLAIKCINYGLGGVIFPNLNVMYNLLIPTLGRIAPSLKELTIHFVGPFRCIIFPTTCIQVDADFEVKFAERLQQSLTQLEKCQVYIEKSKLCYDQVGFETVQFE